MRLILSFLICLLTGAYIGSCAYIDSRRSKAFDAVQVGDTEGTVIGLFRAQPTVREQQGHLFRRYATRPCTAPCMQRLWYENRLGFDTEAWSVELDSSGHVLKKAHWVSP